jgi:hypothetical protein
VSARQGPRAPEVLTRTAAIPNRSGQERRPDQKRRLSPNSDGWRTSSSESDSWRRRIHFSRVLILYRHGDDDQAIARGLQMLVSHLAIIFRYRALYRREFGTLGAWQMVARVCRKRGRRAGLPGTVLWGLAHAVYRLTGDHMGSLDDRGRETRHESR